MRRSITCAILAVALVGCGRGAYLGGDATRPASTATLAITEPTPGARLAADKAIVKLVLTGGRVLEKASKTITPDTGHIHVRLNGTTLTLLAGLEFDLAALNKGPLEKKQHILEAEFVAADHGFFNPRVIVTTTFVAA